MATVSTRACRLQLEVSLRETGRNFCIREEALLERTQHEVTYNWRWLHFHLLVKRHILPNPKGQKSFLLIEAFLHRIKRLHRCLLTFLDIQIDKIGLPHKIYEEDTTEMKLNPQECASQSIQKRGLGRLHIPIHSKKHTRTPVMASRVGWHGADILKWACKSTEMGYHHAHKSTRQNPNGTWVRPLVNKRWRGWYPGRWFEGPWKRFGRDQNSNFLFSPSRGNWYNRYNWYASSLLVNPLLALTTGQVS